MATAAAEKQCVICLDGLAEVGIKHGDSVHTCLCHTCRQRLHRGSPCPICRQPAEDFFKVYI